MPTVSEYREKLNRATLANDQGAIDYFKSQIAKGEAMPHPSAKPVPQGGSILDPLMQGASLGFADEAAGGVSGLYNAVTGGEGGFSGGYTKTRDKWRTDADEYAQRNPVTSLVAELVSGAALPLGAARTAARGVMLGAGAGAVTGAGKAETMEDIPEDAAIGGALGGAGAAALGATQGMFRALVPRRADKAATPTHRADVGRLEGANLPVTPSERLASPSGRAAEKDTAAYFGSGDDLARRPAQIRSELMRRGGFDPDDVAHGDLSHDSLNRAESYFNREYGNALRGQHVDLADMDAPLAVVERRFFDQRMAHEQKAEARRILDDFRDDVANYQYVDDAGNILTTMPGPDYKRIRSNLGKRARQLANQEGPNASLAPIYRGMQDALDQAFQTGAAPDVARRVADLDGQYRHFAFLRDNIGDADNMRALAGKVGSSGVDADLAELLRAYRNVVGSVGGEGAGQASGNLMPPVMSVARTLGAMRPNMPQPVDDALAMIPPGTVTGGTGQFAGMFGPDEIAPEKKKRTRQERRKRSKAAQRARRDYDGDHEYR